MVCISILNLSYMIFNTIKLNQNQFKCLFKSEPNESSQYQEFSRELAFFSLDLEKSFLISRSNLKIRD